MKIPNIDSSVLRLDHRVKSNSMAEILWAKAALLNHWSILANDRTLDGEKCQAGIDHTNQTAKDLGFGEVKRIEFNGQEQEILLDGKKVKVNPSVHFYGSYNDTDIIGGFRGTSSLLEWALNFDCSSTKTDIGDVHQGWYKDVECLEPEIRDWLFSIPGVKSKRLNLAGHSKGSSEMQVFAAMIDKDLPVEIAVGCGSPRPFKAATAKEWSKKFAGRMYISKHANDIVTITPSKVQGYDACGTLMYISDDLKPSIDPWLITMFGDGVKSFIVGAPNIFVGKYPDQFMDHMPSYYYNGAANGAGSKFHLPLWNMKFM